MKKTLFLTLGIVSFFSPPKLYAQEIKKTETIPYQVNTPLTISLASKHDSGSWILDPKNENIKIINQREGYLFTYFTLQVTNEEQKTITFLYQKEGQEPLSRIFLLEKTENSPTSAQKIFGDSPPESKGEGFLTQVEKNDTQNYPMPSIPSYNGAKNESTPEVKKDPKPTSNTFKIYVQSLIENQLYEQARDTFDSYIKDNPTTETDWEYLKDLEISELSSNYQEMIDKADHMLSSPLLNDQTQIAIRSQKAKALEKVGQIPQAQAELLYLKSYFPKEPDVYAQLAEFYLRTHQNAKALKELSFIIDHFSDVTYIDRTYYLLGNYYYKTIGVDGYSISLEYYKKVLAFGMSSSYYQRAKKIVDFLENNLLNYR